MEKKETTVMYFDNPHDVEWFIDMNTAPAFIGAYLEKENDGKYSFNMCSGMDGLIDDHVKDKSIDIDGYMVKLFAYLIDEYTQKNGIKYEQLLNDIKNELARIS